MHIKTVNYQRTFKLERYLGESYRYETLTLGCEVDISVQDHVEVMTKENEGRTTDSLVTPKAFELARNAVKEQLKLAITQAKESQKKTEGAK